MSRLFIEPMSILFSGTTCAAICLAAPAAMAQADLSAQKNRLIAAIEAAGCIVNERNQAAILVEADLTPEQGGIIVNQMMDIGEAEPFGDDLRLKTGDCQ